MGPKTRTTDWSLADDDLDTAMGPATTHEIENGTGDVQLDDPAQAAEMSMATSKAFEELHPKTDSSRDRQIKPNKIYIGGLPDHTRPEDLQNCFGKMGNIVTIELKLGYGFVEFDNRDAAEESVARYHEGYFMGNKIRVELSHSRGRSFKRSEDPGACFKCGESGHWARECPRPSTQSRGGATYDQSSHDRGYSSRDYHHSSRNAHSYRDEYSRQPNSRNDRYYDTTQAAPPPRNHRRALTPPARDRRDDASSRQEYDDYRMQSPPPPVSRHDRTKHHGSERDYVPDQDSYDRYDRRAQHSEDRSAAYPAHGGRARTPPGPPPSSRDDYDKAPRSHHHTHESRRRPLTPPPPYPGGSANGTRSRRRSLSPPRYDSRYYSDADRYSGAPRESTRVRDYHRSNRADDAGHRRP